MLLHAIFQVADIHVRMHVRQILNLIMSGKLEEQLYIELPMMEAHWNVSEEKNAFQYT